MDSVRFVDAWLDRLAALTRPAAATSRAGAPAELPADRVEVGSGRDVDRARLAARIVEGLKAAGGLTACLSAGAASGAPPALVAAMEAAEVVVDPAAERWMGGNVCRFYADRGVLAEDRRAQERLEQVAAPVLELAAPPTGPWSLHLLESEDLNATAGYGGYVFASRGVLSASPSVQAFIFGHEAAHAEGRHALRRHGMSTLVKLLRNGFDQTSYRFSDALGEASLEVQRGFEREADRRGLELALRVGADAREIAAEVANWEEGDDEHPPSAERARALLAQAGLETPQPS